MYRLVSHGRCRTLFMKVVLVSVMYRVSKYLNLRIDFVALQVRVVLPRLQVLCIDSLLFSTRNDYLSIVL